MLARIRKDRGDVDDGAAPGGPERGEGGLQSDEKGPAARRRPMAGNARRTRVRGVRGMSGPRRRKFVGPLVSRVTWHGGRGRRTPQMGPYHRSSDNRSERASSRTMGTYDVVT